MKTLFIAFLLALFPFQARAQVCADLFRAPIFSSKASLRSIQLNPETLPTDSKSPEFKAKLADLLAMWSAAIFHEDTKDPLKKRPLSFARMVGENESVEFEYQADTRAGNDIYRLTEVKFYRANGQSVPLTKDALSDDGKSLRQPSFLLLSEKGKTAPLDVSELAKRAGDLDFKDAGAFEALHGSSASLAISDQELIAKAAAHDFHVPLVIDGPMLESLKWWLTRMPQIKYEEVEAASRSGDATRLFFASSVRHNALYWAKNAKKQVTKLIFWVAVISTIGYLPGTHNLMTYIPMHSRIERILHPHANNIEDAESAIVKSVFADSKQKNSEISASYTAARKHIKETVNGEANDDLKHASLILTSLSDAERKAGGIPVVYEESLHDVSITSNHQTILKKYSNGFEKSFILAQFKKLSAIVLIPVVEDEATGETRVSVLRYTAKDNPLTYVALDAALAKKVHSANAHKGDIESAEALAY